MGVPDSTESPNDTSDMEDLPASPETFGLTLTVNPIPLALIASMVGIVAVYRIAKYKTLRQTM